MKNMNNLFGGYTIALNDIWATEVKIIKYELKENKYSGIYQVTLWDHFGLDRVDIEADKIAGWGAGFMDWFILQHYRGYKPFITQVTFENEIEGKIECPN
jgi:hypothetical protein